MIAPPYSCPEDDLPFRRTERGTYVDEVELQPDGSLSPIQGSNELDAETDWLCPNGHFRPCVRTFGGAGAACSEHHDLWPRWDPACITVTYAHKP